MSAGHRTLWIVIADGGHARVVVAKDHPGQFETDWAVDSPDAHHAGRDLVSDRPGRVFSSARRPGRAGGGLASGRGTEGTAVARHALVPPSDPREEAKRSFAELLAQFLDDEAGRGAFDELVLVAPGHVMHDLRARLGRLANERVTGTLLKDLTAIPDRDLSQHLATWWRPPRQGD